MLIPSGTSSDQGAAIGVSSISEDLGVGSSVMATIQTSVIQNTGGSSKCYEGTIFSFVQ